MIYLKLILVGLFWAGGFIATRIAAQSFGPFTGAALRYVMACMLLLPLSMKVSPGLFRVSRQQFFRLCLLGFSGVFAYNFFFFKGLSLVPASHGSLVVALNPIMVLLFSAWRYGEPVKGIRLAGVLLALLGVIIVISRGYPMQIWDGIGWGDIYMLGCPVTWAIYTIAGKAALRESSPLEATTWASVSGCIMLLLFAGFESWPAEVPTKVWLAFLYMSSIGTVLAFVWYYEGVRVIGASNAAVFNNLIPVFVLLLSVWVLEEKVATYTYLGAILVLTGIALVNHEFIRSLLKKPSPKG